MKRKRIAIILLLLYIAAFCASGVTASCTAKEVTMTTSVSHFNSLYSLSSAAVLILPVLMVVALFAFRHAWNDYLWPTIVMNSPKNQTLTSGLALLAGQYETGQWTHLLASTVISMLPPLLLYFTCQKYFLQGISVQASVKGRSRFFRLCSRKEHGRFFLAGKTGIVIKNQV